MKGIMILLCLLIVCLLMNSAGAEQNNAINNSKHQDMKNLIGKISDEIAIGLEDVESANEKSAQALTNSTLEGDYVSTVLNNKVSAIPFAHSSLVILPSGLVTAAAPDEYQNLVGMTLNDTAVITANEKKKPVLSDIFLLSEGFYGVSLSYPIISPEKKYQGYTDLTFRPEEFLRQYIIPVVEQSRYDVMILQPNGPIVYETNEEEIGRNAISDPLYAEPTLHQAAINITSHKSGITSYQFWNQNWNKIVPREAIWDTLEFDGQEWRIVVISDMEDSESVGNLETEINTKNTQDLNSSIISLTKYIENATDFPKINGKGTALSAFNNQTGPFVSGDRYIFAYDMNGTALALPFQQGFIGKNWMNLTDVNGFSILPAMIDRASDGGGYLYFVYPNPTENYTPMLKLFQVKPVDKDWFIGSGIYIPHIQASVSPQNLSELSTRVKKAAIHADEVGKEKAIVDFNDINGTYADGGDYIFAYGYDGTTLALPHQPELIGTNRIDYTDQFGCQIIRMEIEAAKRGGGYVYIVYKNPDPKKNELKLCYVTPAGDDWFVGSGIYTGQNLDG